MAPRKRVTRAVVLSAAVLIVMTIMAVPGNATFAKKYNLTIAPSTAPAGASTVFTATYTNKSLFKIGSTQLSVPSGFTITGASTSRGTATSTSTSVKVLSLNLSLNSSFTIAVTANVSCSAATASWSAVTKTGNDFSGSLFSLNNPGSAQKTTVTGACQLVFVDQPPDTAVDEVINAPAGIAVRAQNGAGQPTAGVSVAMGATGPGDLSGTSPVTTAGSPASAVFSDLSVDEAGTYTLNATATGYASATSEEFVVAGDILECNEEYPASPSGGAASDVDLNRETGACGEDVPVTIIVREDEVEVQKPTIEGTAFRMTIEWVAETANNPVPATEIDYLNDEIGFHPMQFCLADGGDGDSYPDLPAGEFWCITNQTVTLFETGPNAGDLQLTESYFGAGDPKFTRG